MKGRVHLDCPQCGGTYVVLDSDRFPCDECGWGGEETGGRFHGTPPTGPYSCDFDVVAALGYATVADFRKNTCTS